VRHIRNADTEMRVPAVGLGLRAAEGDYGTGQDQVAMRLGLWREHPSMADHETEVGPAKSGHVRIQFGDKPDGAGVSVRVWKNPWPPSTAQATSWT
jgi:hypothetical protein